MKNIKYRFFLAAVLAVNFLGLHLNAEIKEGRRIGPETMYFHEYIESGPWNIYILKFKLDNPNLDLAVMTAHDHLSGREQTSSMANRLAESQVKVLGGVNADFFSQEGLPIGAEIINHEITKKPYPRSCFGIFTDKTLLMDIVDFNATVRCSNDSAASISAINKHRQEDQIVLFNRFWDDSTHSNIWGTEIISRYVTGSVTNETFQVIVTEIDSGDSNPAGNNHIPADGIVLSGHGKGNAFLQENISIGDTLELMLKLGENPKPIKELVGGLPRIIRNGKVSVEWEQETARESFGTERHPRTAVGFTADSSEVIFVAVDGRQSGYSVGMSLYELAEYMLDWGITEAMNLDGGGSTTMIVDSDIVNRPSDETGERAVGNALFLVSNAKADSLVDIQIETKQQFLSPGTTHQFKLCGISPYYSKMPIITPAVWNCPEKLGRIDSTGLLITKETMESGFVTVNFMGFTDSVYIGKKIGQ